MSRQDYNWIHEPILYGWKPGAAHYFTDDFTQTTAKGEQRRPIKKMSKRELQQYAEELRKRIDEGTTIIRADKPANNSMHPTMKPVPLCGELMRNSSIPGNTVLDPFSGSGSTLMAAEQLGRKCLAIELDPLYASGTIIRWQNETGKKAVKITRPKKGAKK
jgi:DNA modification methylase